MALLVEMGRESQVRLIPVFLWVDKIFSIDISE